ncbi:UNVERIFIED_CONTAM: hypothetical protein GTU68_023058 [Idotea baltica]|nr:hypothetical protein [Idotea baltica]
MTTSTNKNFLEVRNLDVRFRSNKSDVHALKSISFSVEKGEILGIVGESGSGKSTIAKSIVGIINPTKGTINYTNKNKVTEVLTGEPRKDIQLVFQDPYSSLNPSMSIGKGLYELLRYHRIVPKSEIKTRITTLLEQVGLSNSFYDRLPRELSGGQRQRVCIARALSLEPNVLICDECVSALDVTVQAQVLGLLLKLRRDIGLSILFISHDLAVINEVCDRVLVMDRGRIVESGAPFEIINTPKNPYTQRLISSIPGQ